MSRIGQPIEKESRLVVVRGWEKEEWAATACTWIRRILWGLSECPEAICSKSSVLNKCDAPSFIY